MGGGVERGRGGRGIVGRRRGEGLLHFVLYIVSNFLSAASLASRRHRAAREYLPRYIITYTQC